MAPHRCPICNGKGIVPPGFYTSTGCEWSGTSMIPETCRSCNGAGIVWEREPFKTYEETLAEELGGMIAKVLD